MKWKKITPSSDKPPASLAFLPNTGFQLPLFANPSPMDVFFEFFDSTLLELLVVETNK